MIILGIDPALTNSGWGVINFKNSKPEYIDSGIIKSGNAQEMITTRLATITSQFEVVIAKYNPEIVAMEEIFVNKNAVSSLKLGYARGAIMAIIGKHNLAFQEFKPNLVKKTVVGTGHAEKNQILYMIKLLIPGIRHISNFDEADALAVAYTSSIISRDISTRSNL